MADNQRLDGWKAIGNFLGRDRTTAIRWARERGLPVHRLPGGRTGTVYALESELRDWMAKGKEAARSPVPSEVRDDPVPEQAPPVADSRIGQRRGIWLWVAAAALAAVFVFTWRMMAGADAPVSIAAIASTRDDPATRGFSRDLTADLARFANASGGLAVYDPEGDAGKRADFSVHTAIDGVAPRLAVRVWLTASRDGAVLWSRRIEQATPELAALRERVAADVVGIVRCGMDMSSNERGALGSAGIALLLSTCQAFLDQEIGAATAHARALIDQAPRLAAGYALLAIAQANRRDARDRGTLAAARANAQRAERIAPGSLAAYAAANAAAGLPSPFALPVVEKALRAFPSQPAFLHMRSVALFNAGYVRESVEPALAARRIDPTWLEHRNLVTRRLAAAGRFDEALRAQQETERLWPGHPEVVIHRTRLLAEAGKEGRADDALRTAQRATLERQATAEPHLAYAIAAAFERAGDRRAALEWLARAPVGDAALHQWSNLFWPGLEGLRTEPAFFDKMAQIGLVRVWLARKRWPDFCSEPGLKYDCATRADALGRAARTPASPTKAP